MVTGRRDGRLRRRIAGVLFAFGAALIVVWMVLGMLPRRLDGGDVVIELPGGLLLDTQVPPFVALVGGGALGAGVAAWIGGALRRYDRGEG